MKLLNNIRNRLNEMLDKPVPGKEEIIENLPIIIRNKTYNNEKREERKYGEEKGEWDMAYWLMLLLKDVTRFEARQKNADPGYKLYLAKEFCDSYEFHYLDMIKPHLDSNNNGLGQFTINVIEREQYLSYENKYKTIPELYEECKKIIKEAEKK